MIATVRLRFCAWTAAALLACAWPADAQTAPVDPATTARIRLGPFWINPSLIVKNIGVDTNVFNDGEAPKSDFTATVSPATDVFVRVASLRADFRVVSELLYFKRYASERSANTLYSGVLSGGGLTRLAPYVGADYSSTRERPGFEIDARARHSLTRLRAGADFKVGTRSTVGVEIQSARTRFADKVEFRRVDLGEQLNRAERVARVQVKHALTPLTRITASFDVESDRFNDVRARDSDSYRFSAGVEFEPAALISGGAAFGYRSLTFLGGSLAGNSGFVTSVNLTYAAPTSTRLTLTAARDTQYSYDPNHPYYLQTGAILVATQRLIGGWDVQLTGGRQNIDYRDEFGVRGESDRVTQYGIGVGYSLGRTVRIGFSILHGRRVSPDPLRRYEGNQIGSNITYGT